MDRQSSSRMATFARVSAYLAAQPGETEGEQQLAANLEAVRERLAAQDQEYRVGELETLTFGRMRRELRSSIERGELRIITRSAQRAAETRPDFAERYRRPRTDRAQDFATAASDIVVAAREDAAVLGAYGLPTGIVDSLEQRLAEWRAMGTQVEDFRRRRMTAQRAIKATVREGMRLVRQLDAIRSFRYREDPATLATWRAAIAVVAPASPKPAKEDEAPAA